MTARRRVDHLVLVPSEEELIVYDERRHRAHRLDARATLVWRACDGRTGVPAIAAAVSRACGAPVSEDVVWHTLRRLDRLRLLDHMPPVPPGVPLGRRQLLARLASAGLGAAALPLIATMVAPTPAEALSSGLLSSGMPCVSGSQCVSGICLASGMCG